MVDCQFRRGIGSVDGPYVTVVNPNIGTYFEIEVGAPAVGELAGADNDGSLGESSFGVGNATNEVQERSASAAGEDFIATAPHVAVLGIGLAPGDDGLTGFELLDATGDGTGDRDGHLEVDEKFGFGATVEVEPFGFGDDVYGNPTHLL